jgi:hypothetical protein
VLTDIPSEGRGHKAEEKSLRRQVLEAAGFTNPSSLGLLADEVKVYCSFVYILGIN